jgi:hypothetical protein
MTRLPALALGFEDAALDFALRSFDETGFAIDGEHEATYGDVDPKLPGPVAERVSLQCHRSAAPITCGTFR